MKLRGFFLASLVALHGTDSLADDTDRCNGPFYTLHSQCPGDPGNDLLCIKFDLRNGELSPCDDPENKSVKNRNDCERPQGATCDVIYYDARISKTTVRFRIPFSASDIGDGIGGSYSGSSDDDDDDDVEVGDTDVRDDVEVGDAEAVVSRSGLVAGPNVAWESDLNVDAIGVLELPAEVTQLELIGGRSEDGTQGMISSVLIDPLMLSRSPQIRTLYLANLNLDSQLVDGDLIRGFPSDLLTLKLSNVMLQSVPQQLSTLKKLKTLQLRKNYLAESPFPRDISLPSLTDLRVTSCGLTSFDGYFPELTTLDLRDNQLVAIPDVVYEMRQLTTLYLQGNPITTFTVTPSQAAFLDGLVSFDSDVTADTIGPTLLRPVGSAPASANSNENASSGNALPSSVASGSSGSQPTASEWWPIGTRKVLRNGGVVWIVSEDEHAAYKAQELARMKAASPAIVPNESPTGSSLTTPSSTVNGPDSTSTPTSQDRNIENMEPPGSSSNSTANPPTKGRSRTDQTANPNVAADEDGQTTSTNTHSFPTVLVLALCAVGAVLALFIVSRKRAASRAKATSCPSTPATVGSPSTHFVAMAHGSATKEIGSSPAPSSAVGGQHLRDLFSSRRVRQSDLKDVRLLHASTNGGIVMLVEHRGARQLASKRLVPSKATQQRMAEFVNEIVLIAELDHPNIVSLVGVAWSSGKDLQALFEYMPQGDLQSCLTQVEASAWSWDSTKLQLAIDIVEALVYAHSFSPPLLHRDLRTRHVLLDDDSHARVSGLGSARYVSEQDTMTSGVVGSNLWAAPEVLAGSSDYDAPSDMYAFGVVLYELDTHCAPYCDALQAAVTGIVGEAAMLERVVAGTLRPTLSSQCPSAILALATRCWAPNPRDRPSAMQVAYELRQLMLS